MLFHHVGIHVSDFKKSVKLYDALMNALGVGSFEIPKHIADRYGTETLKYYGDPKSSFRVVQPESGVVVPSSSHLCLTAPNKKAVDAFFVAAQAFAINEVHAPNEYQLEGHIAYNGFIKDFDGNYIEVVYEEPT